MYRIVAFSAEHKGGPLKAHPLTESVPGGMSEEEFKALCISIKEEGLDQPVIVFEGQILDGRERYRACIKENIPPDMREFQGTAKEAKEYVVKNNLQRKTLNAMQKALVGARMCTRAENPLTQRDAAERMGVSTLTLNTAIKLLDKKNASLLRRCEKGDLGRNEACELLAERNKAAEPSNVVPIGTMTNASIALKRTSKGKSAKETTASKMVASYRRMDKAEQKSFVEMAWQWLQPILLATGKLPTFNKTHSLHSMVSRPDSETAKYKAKKRKAA